MAPGLSRQVRMSSFWPEVHPEGQFTDNIHVDLAHIYAELRHGLELMEQGDVKSAIDYWHDSYFFHWGHHAAAAVWAMEEHDPKLKRGGGGCGGNGS